MSDYVSRFFLVIVIFMFCLMAVQKEKCKVQDEQIRCLSNELAELRENIRSDTISVKE